MTIVAVAIRQGELIHSLPKPARHSDVIHRIFKDSDSKTAVKGEQGFLTSLGTFVDRYEAGRIVGINRKLFSEDLW